MENSERSLSKPSKQTRDTSEQAIALDISNSVFEGSRHNGATTCSDIEDS